MKTSRGLAAAVVAVMVPTLLAGCFLLPESDHGPLVTTDSELQIADDMYAQVAELNRLDGINATYDGAQVFDGIVAYSHQITIEAQDASKADMTWAIVNTWAAFVDPSVASQSVRLHVDGGRRGELDVTRSENSGSEISEDQLTFEVHYWLEFGGVVLGPVYDSISAGAPGEGYFRDVGTLSSLIDFDYGALYTLPEFAEGARATSYSICGVFSNGGLPPIDELKFGAEFQRLLAAAPQGATAQSRIGLSSKGQTYAQVDLNFDGVETISLDSSEYWPYILEFVELLSARPDDAWVGVLHVSPELDSSEGRVSMTIGTCAMELNPRDADTAFFDLFADVVLADGSQAGACVRF